ncbi:hypothetical protein HDF22_004787 [Mucilaginibacter lappiensis]|uniref:Uncharacterized protein n=1 Tax=Mucilaginibacter lappiensis TaxID=354630 RepID=A0A841JJI6_9SPHI|nr:hypothetical protein [Mucilaginibacter lappiensis]
MPVRYSSFKLIEKINYEKDFNYVHGLIHDKL